MPDLSLLDGQLEESHRRIMRASRRARDCGISLDGPMGPTHCLYLLALSHKALLLSVGR